MTQTTCFPFDFCLKKEWCKFCIIFFDQATIIFKNYQRWTMEKRYKHIIFQNIIKTCWVVEVFDVLSVWFQYFVSNFSSIFTTTNLSKMNHNYFCIFDVLLLSALFFLGFQIMVLYHITILYQVLYVPNIWWCCTTHRTKSRCWTSSICGTSLWISSLSLRPSQNHKKSLKTLPKKSRETFKNHRNNKRSISRKSWPRYVSSKSCWK